jgi:hypothetical protein
MATKDTKFHVNYDRVINEKDLLAVTRLLAVDLKNNPYKSVGDFMRELSDSDLDILSGLCDDTECEKFAEILLISEMLARAEGLDPANLKDSHTRTSTMVGFITCESLFRKGLVKIYHENMSFGDDQKNKILVERIGDADGH